MTTENVNNRKHYRAYIRKNKKGSSDRCELTHKKSAVIGLIGLAFIKGFFWGYIIKGKRR
ncbi:hypothetical protein [Petroclostridium sp. X23]|uniref:hypothetical protein n=1 Tax=Petroclostridium sp. X23 TaxID=3045146 RepID=UPI0024ADD9B8|nr:hypothetical protein [Petroclostridium sp. X23]WHH58878.1 hypothetical protein QKW49_24310 [Petroclostridium sp. X23]